MSFTHKQVAERWAAGEKATGNHMYTDGKAIFSYGNHFPIAVHLCHGQVLFNTDKYSNSTSNHQRYVNCALPDYVEKIECTTQDIKYFLDNPDKPVVIIKEEQPKELYRILQLLRDYCKSHGMKRFQMKKWEQTIMNKLIAENI